MKNESLERRKEGLKSLGKKTEYKTNYAPEVLETFKTNTQKMIIGSNSIVQSLHLYVQ
jgi:hypothetical protein